MPWYDYDQDKGNSKKSKSQEIVLTDDNAEEWEKFFNKFK